MRRGSFLLLTLVLLAGCSSGSFLSQRFENFTARYNAFYNAEKAFNKGVKGLEQSDAAIDRSTYLMVFPSPDRAATGQEFTSAIKKSADVLRNHPTSKWVDDALLLIGKSYFYQRNFVGAEQKFREIMGLGGHLGDEARFWLARTLIVAGSYDEAAKHLTESLAGEDLSSYWRPRLYLMEGQLNIRQGNWAEAADALKKGLNGIHDNALRARTQFLIGQVYETLGRYDDAVQAFAGVERYHPVYELSYAAQLSAARVEGLHGNPDAAMQALRRMERDDKHFNKRPEIAYVQGLVLEASGRPDDALATYRGILYGEGDANIQSTRGLVQYAMAALFRDAYRDFVTASARFDTAATLIGSTPGMHTLGSGDGLRYTQDAITDGKEQAQVFHSFATAVGDVARMDSLLRLGAMDDETFDAFVLDLRKQLAREQAEQQKEAARRKAEQEFRSGAARDAMHQPTEGPSSTEGGASFLFNQEPARVQEGRMVFVDRWGDRPLVPNWRRQEAINAIAVAAAQGDSSAIAQTAIAESASSEAILPPVDVSMVPRTPGAVADMLEQRAEGRYKVGNVLFLAMNRPDSAAAWYRMVIEQDADQPVARRAYYALAEVDRALGDTASANRLYRKILDQYSESDFAALVRERLGMPHDELIGVDSLARAEAAYADAYAEWKAGRRRESIRDMFAVAAVYPNTSVAPRALFAAASAYTELVRTDSLDLLDDLHVALPDSVLKAAGIAVQEAPTATLKPDSLIAPQAVRQALADSLARRDSLLARPQMGISEPVILPASEIISGSQETPDAGVALDAIYSAIMKHYGKSEYADPSRRMLDVLDARRQERASADSAAAAARSAAAMTATDIQADSTASGVPNTGVPAADSLRQTLPLEQQAAVDSASAPGARDSVQAPVRRRSDDLLKAKRERLLEARRGRAAASDSTDGSKATLPRKPLLEP